jgi:hypothetical protein
MRERSPEGRLYRIGRSPDPWAWPDWADAAADGTFGNRWDDPRSSYRVLYAASDRLGAFIEVLARFRPDPHVVAALREIEGDDAPLLPPGSLHVSWLENRMIGEASVAGSFADVGHSESLAELRRDLAGRLIHYNLPDLDGSAIRLKAPRRLTQEISRYVYEQTTEAGQRACAGISYLSRLGDELRNWAIFEPATELEALALARDAKVTAIAPDDPDFLRALQIHGLERVGV